MAGRHVTLFCLPSPYLIWPVGMSRFFASLPNKSTQFCELSRLANVWAHELKYFFVIWYFEFLTQKMPFSKKRDPNWINFLPKKRDILVKKSVTCRFLGKICEFLKKKVYGMNGALRLTSKNTTFAPQADFFRGKRHFFIFDLDVTLFSDHFGRVGTLDVIFLVIGRCYSHGNW